MMAPDLPALNIAGQPVVLGIVELDPTTVAPALTLDIVPEPASWVLLAAAAMAATAWRLSRRRRD
jgi:hypothetical protein